MARIKITLPEKFIFQTIIPVRITDLNYGGHVGNDSILSIVHESRMQFLHHFGYTELNIETLSLIMSDVGIEFKSELFYGDQLNVQVTVTDLNRVGFDMYYKLEKKIGDQFSLVAAVKTGMLFFNYQERKVVSVPAAFRNKFS